ncbi:hypothetical protein ATW55_02790 [Ferroacidibacillus organovorans]|uniref:Uncharacterized protein n=1 Tax=Ferroacidibacillus organovorans TaxID=1765683 RepID=A0A124IW19_9BACL|nr:hypothetical protein ATW55_02790 [Ferroacidibacillus organovorans]
MLLLLKQIGQQNVVIQSFETVNLPIVLISRINNVQAYYLACYLRLVRKIAPANPRLATGDLA